jgi:molybdate transport system ATP-binding protein
MVEIDLALRVADGQRQFAAHLSFAHAGPIITLYGPSGAGKSLTLRAIAGLIPATGTVRVGATTWLDSQHGINVPAAKRGVGLVFQDYALFPHLSVFENVAFALREWPFPLATKARQQVTETLAALGIEALGSARIQDLSGGQRQRVALARALVGRPNLLLLDEPFAALNPLLRGECRQQLLATVEQFNIPAIVITHDSEDVLALANVAYWVERGEIVREIDLDRLVCRDRRPLDLSFAQKEAPPMRAGEAQLRTWLQEVSG